MTFKEKKTRLCIRLNGLVRHAISIKELGKTIPDDLWELISDYVTDLSMIDPARAKLYMLLVNSPENLATYGHEVLSYGNFDRKFERPIH